MSDVIISTGYQPRTLQGYLHNALRRFNVLVCHRRFGKTVFSINELIDQALRNPLKNPQYAYIAPFFSQAKRVAWDYLKDFTKNIPGASPHEQELRVDIPRPDKGDRIRIMLLGADNPGSIRGIYLDGSVLDEYAEMDPTVWSQVVRPALSDRHVMDKNQGWAIFIGTPKGRNHFYDIFSKAKGAPDWFTAMFKASETGIIPKSELDAARLTMSDEEYEQEFECSFTAALVGAYWGKEISLAEKEGRIREVPHDSSLLVNLYFDLGIDDSTAIWFLQQIQGQNRLIRYIEDAGVGLPEYAKRLKGFNYNYGDIWFPHDGAARDLSSGVSRQQTMRELMGQSVLVSERHAVEDGIHAARTLLSTCYFDGKNCERGIDALKNYERKWDAKNKIFISRPNHNWASHGADAFRNLAMNARRGDHIVSTKKRNLPRYAQGDYDYFKGAKNG